MKIKAFERSTGRAVVAYQPAKGSVVELGNGIAAPIRSKDDWIVSFDDGAPPIDCQSENSKRSWWYSNGAFVAAFESYGVEHE